MFSDPVFRANTDIYKKTSVLIVEKRESHTETLENRDEVDENVRIIIGIIRRNSCLISRNGHESHERATVEVFGRPPIFIYEGQVDQFYAQHLPKNKHGNFTLLFVTASILQHRSNISWL